MTLRVPDDLAELRALAVELGGAPAFVVREPASGEEWDGLELPILHVELNSDQDYIQIRTAVPVAGRHPSGALTFEAVLAKLEQLAAPGQERELFWVSSLRPLAPETDPEMSRFAVRLALPLGAVMASEDPVGVSFLARTGGVSLPRTA